MLKLGWADALADVWRWGEETRLGGILEGDSLQTATMVNAPKAGISSRLCLNKGCWR